MDERKPLVASLGWADAPLLAYTAQALFLWSVTFSTYVPLLGFYAERYGLSVAELGAVAAALQVGWLVSLPALPALLRCAGARRSVQLGLVLFALAAVPFCLAPTFAGLLAARAVEGIGVAVLMPVLDAVLTRNLPPERRGQGFGYRHVLGHSGKLFGLLVSTVLHPLGGLELTLGVISAATVVAMALGGFAPDAWFEVEVSRPGNMWRCFTAKRAPLYVLHLLRFCGQSVLYLALPLHFVDEDGGVPLPMVQVSAFWLASDLLAMLAYSTGGQAADAFAPHWVLLVSQGLWAACLGLMAAEHLCGRWRLPCLLAAAAGAQFLFSFGSPAFAKLLTSKQIAGGVTSEELWASAHLVCTAALIAGSLLGAALYQHVGFAALQGGLAVCLLLATIYAKCAFDRLALDVPAVLSPRTQNHLVPRAR